MSMPFLSITCAACDFQGSSLATVGQYLWSHDGQTCPLERRLGLCLDCNKVVAIENFPSAEILEHARSIRKTYIGKPLFRFEDADYAKYLASQHGFEVLECVIGLARRPVCLVCGKSSIRPINIPEGVNSKTDIPVSINLGHPWCAGTLQVRGSDGMRIGLRPVTRTYNIYGQLVSIDHE